MKTTIAILFPWFGIEAKPEMNNNHKDSQLEIDFNKKEENKNINDLEKYNKKELIQRCNELRKMYNEITIKHDETLKKYKHDIEYYKKLKKENENIVNRYNKLDFDIQYKNSIIDTQKETIESLSKKLESSRCDRLIAIKVLNETINEQNKTINEQNETINELRNYISSLCTIQYGIHAT